MTVEVGQIDGVWFVTLWRGEQVVDRIRCPSKRYAEDYAERLANQAPQWTLKRS